MAVAGVGRLEIPRGYRWAEGIDARRLMESLGNPDPEASGAVMSEEGDAPFLVTFRFIAEGYVTDNEKDRLDAGGLLGSIVSATERDNEVRRRRGWPTIDDARWEKTPFYDPRTHNLTWAVRFDSAGRPGLNYDVRLLGRSGNMQVKLISEPARLATTSLSLYSLLEGYAFDPGAKYEDYVAGDRRARYGLVAIVGGASAAIAAKSGLLGRPHPHPGGAAPGRPSIVPPLAPGPFLGATAKGTKLGSPNPGRAPWTSTQSPASAPRVPLGIAPGPAYGGGAFARTAQGVNRFAMPPLSRPRTSSGPVPAGGQGGRGPEKGLLAAMGAAIVGAWAWLKKKLAGDRGTRPTTT